MPSADDKSILHPLTGANLRTAIGHWARNFPFSLGTIHIRALVALCVGVRFPNYTIERLRLRKKLANHQVEEGPYFLIGHWRSGTTHLHNLLSQDPRFGYMSFLQAVLPWDIMGKYKPARPIMASVMPETRGMDDVKVSIDSPQEEEMALSAMNPLSFFNCFYFPKKAQKHFRQSILFEDTSPAQREKFAETYRYLVQKFSYANGGSPLLLKNPANTARIRFIKENFPNAKFVHIVRNPFEVYASMGKLWPRLFGAFSLQDHRRVDTGKLTLDGYHSVMQRYLAEHVDLPESDLIEIRFEDLESGAVSQIERIYSHFGLADPAPALEKISAYADSQSDYRRSVYKIPQATVDTIRDRWGFALEKWGYDVPPSIEVS